MKLPKQLFVKIDGEGRDQFYNTADKAEHLVDMGETVQIGRYELVEIAEATGIAQIVPPKAKRIRGPHR